MTPVFGGETAGSYPPQNCGTVHALRADANSSHSVFLDDRLLGSSPTRVSDHLQRVSVAIGAIIGP